jgi:hypothetical protein
MACTWITLPLLLESGPKAQKQCNGLFMTDLTSLVSSSDYRASNGQTPAKYIGRDLEGIGRG